MNKLVLCVAVLVLIAVQAFAAYSSDHNEWTFDRFLTQFPRDYSDARSNAFNTFTYETRRLIFAANMESIKQHNKRYEQGLESWFQRPNQFTDLTQDEFVQNHLGFDKSSPSFKNRHANRLMKLSQASSTISNWAPIDWEAKGMMPDPVNQGSCGSCWANAASNTLAAHLNIKYGSKSDSNYPSRQAFTSCVVNDRECGGTGGCKGATAQLAWTYLKEIGGVASEKDYPYTSGGGDDGKCLDTKFSKTLTIAGYTDIIPNNRTALYEALKIGPVAVSADASGWAFYGGGVFTKCGQYAINHAITYIATGFDERTNQYFHKIRNSWGPTWGEKGNMSLYQAAPEAAEVCGEDKSPWDGSACKDDPAPRTEACGCNGILYDSAIPYGVNKI